MKRPTFNAVTLALTIVAIGSLGCGGNNSGSESSGPKQVSKETLPELGDYVDQPIDSSRLDVAPPKGWQSSTSMTGSLARFNRFDVKSARLPSIHIRAEDSPFEDFPNVSQDRLADFADAMVDFIDERENGAKLLEPVKPMLIGDQPCVRYVKAAQFRFQTPVPKRVKGEVQVLMTLFNDRLYTLELRVRDKDQLTKYRDHAYAVFAGMKLASDDGGNAGEKLENQKKAAAKNAKENAK